jgi:chemotaxis protein MotA
MRSTSVRYVPDLVSFLGLAVSLAGVVGGLLLEGGEVADISQATGGLIVFGGTLGAVFLTTPGGQLLMAARALKLVFFEPRRSMRDITDLILMFANKARKGGIVSLEPEVEALDDPFLRKAMQLAVDGTEIATLRSIMESQIVAAADKGQSCARVYESAGGYAPTVGIIGAVLGLIQVMKHLQQIDQVGHGIAVAFVATVYGVASANLLFLPAAGKIRARTRETTRVQEMLLDGVCGIAQGLNPKMIQAKLATWTGDEAQGNQGPRRYMRPAA